MLIISEIWKLDIKKTYENADWEMKQVKIKKNFYHKGDMPITKSMANTLGRTVKLSGMMNQVVDHSCPT